MPRHRIASSLLPSIEVERTTWRNTALGLGFTLQCSHFGLMSDDREQELAQFREAWKAEVSERKKPHQGQSNPRSVGQSSRQQLDEIPRHSQDNAHTAVSAGALPVIEDHHRGVDVDRKNVPSAGSLEALLDSFPEGLTFLPEVGESPPPIASLPDELLLHILRKLGPDSIERLACVCRKARVLTLEPVIWKCVSPQFPAE